jgi:hypothetical protein
VAVSDSVRKFRCKTAYHPRQQLRVEHFVWSDDFTELIGISPTGRATIVRLQLNREGVVNLRQLLREKNLHPPN